MQPEPSTDVRMDALRTISNGVYVLTACPDDFVHAATITWVSQVSVQPPLVMVALRRNSHLLHAVRQARRFSLNVLEAGQTEMAGTFFEHLVAPVSQENLAGYPFRASAARCPLLLDALAWIECRIAAEPESPGDHNLVLGEVSGAGIRREGDPLTLWETPWSYGGRQIA